MDLVIDGKCERIPPGSHILHLYTKPQEVVNVSGNICVDGFAAKEKCIVIAPPQTVADIQHYMLDRHCDTVATQQFSYVDSKDALLDNGRFNPYRMLAQHQTAIAQALRQGWRAVRIAIDMTWVCQGSATPQDIIKYEAACDAVFTFQNAPVAVLVNYDYAKVSGELVIEMLKLHPIAVVGKYIKRNPYYLNSEHYLLKLLRSQQQ